MKARSCVRLSLCVLLPMVLAGLPAGAVTYLSVEPIPNQAVVGGQVLDNLLDLEPEVRMRWAELLAGCGLVQGVLDALASDGTLTTVNGTNTIFGVAAGGFEGQTNPTYVFTFVDSNVNAVSAADIETVANALGYVFSQGGTVHFSPDEPALYDFPLDYVTATFSSGPPGLAEAQAFFEHVGTVDPELFTGLFAGYTQIGAALLFLQPAAGTQQFVDGMFEATAMSPGVEYAPLDMNGDPTTALAGIAFRGNDWSADPEGRGYLNNVAQDPDADLGKLANLDDWRRFHRRAVKVLNRQAVNGRFVDHGVRTLERIFQCYR
jgi:hypothetical protein